jgi:hypothetical protein
MAEPESEEFVDCHVEDGLFVRPCLVLQSVIDNNIPGFSKGKGVFIQNLTNTKTMKPARTYVGVKSKKRPNGILFNFCPFCGGAIHAPFTDQEQEP